MIPIDTTTLDNLAKSILVAGVLGGIVSSFWAKAPYFRIWFASLDGKNFLGESAQLSIVIITTIIFGLLAFLYIHQKALSAITPDDVLPLALAIGAAIGGSQLYNSKINIPEQIAKTAATATATAPAGGTATAAALPPASPSSSGNLGKGI